MTLTELRKLAEAATPGPWTWERIAEEGSIPVLTMNGPSVLCRWWEGFGRNNERAPTDATYMAALSPERILAMLDVIEAADAMRSNRSEWARAAYDAARKRLDAGRTMTIKWTPDGKVDRDVFRWVTRASDLSDLADALDECVAALRDIQAQGDRFSYRVALETLRKIGAER